MNKIVALLSNLKFSGLKGKSAVISFRLVIMLLLFFFSLYSGQGFALDEIHRSLLPYLCGIGFFYLASNGFILWAPVSFLKKWFLAALFLFDLVLISLSLYWLQGFETDLFLIYFLVIFMAAIARKPSITFLVAGIACLLYGLLFLKSHPASDLLQPALLIRFPLLLVVGFFSSVIIEDSETEKEALRQQMENYWLRSERLAALGEMASGIAHEINNPLTSILGTVQLYLDELESPDLKTSRVITVNPQCLVVSSEDLKVIERNALRCKNIVADLLKFASRHEFVFEKIDLKELLKETAALLSLQLARVQMEWKLSETERYFVSGSIPHLKQVFFNLFSNAIQSMPEGGKLLLALSRTTEKNARQIEMSLIEVLIADTGHGISAADQERIFQPFFTTREPGKGAGLGLAVVYGLIRKHNGKISILSEGIGKGTKILIHLPALGENP